MIFSEKKSVEILLQKAYIFYSSLLTFIENIVKFRSETFFTKYMDIIFSSLKIMQAV